MICCCQIYQLCATPTAPGGVLYLVPLLKVSLSQEYLLKGCVNSKRNVALNKIKTDQLFRRCQNAGGLKDLASLKRLLSAYSAEIYHSLNF